MNEIKFFGNAEFGSVRVVETEEGKVLFCGADVAKALGYSNARDALLRHCKEKGVVKCDTLTKGGMQTLTYINEGNVYRLITHSKLPDAERFESWVFDEVLPSIRKTGSYGEINLEELIAKTATAVAIEVTKQLMVAQHQEVRLNTKPVKKMAKAYKYSSPSKISTLPPEVKEHVDEMLRSGNYSCQNVANFIINSTGMYISQMAVNRYKRSNFEIIDSEI